MYTTLQNTTANEQFISYFISTNYAISIRLYFHYTVTCLFWWLLDNIGKCQGSFPFTIAQLPSNPTSVFVYVDIQHCESLAFYNTLLILCYCSAAWWYRISYHDIRGQLIKPLVSFDTFTLLSVCFSKSIQVVHTQIKVIFIVGIS